MSKRRRHYKWLTYPVGLAVFAWLVFGGPLMLKNPKAPIPENWNPAQPLNIRAELTPMTRWKLKNAIGSALTCEAALETAAVFQTQDDKLESDVCHIENRVKVTQVADATIRSTETRCDLAVVMSMWVEHGVQPAAQEYFDMPVRSIQTQGSYNCRKIFGTNRMSKHAQAKAIDVSGFTLANGRKINLVDHWNGSEAEQAFLRKVRDNACEWFSTTLGPDYNRAHADHFHLQSEGWGTCR